MTVEIVVGTYNGERFISAQLESLLAQIFSEFRILVSDDGSSDSTVSVISEFVERNPGRFLMLQACKGKGARGNFSRLLQASTADYVFLCDQDDVWDADKVAVSLEAMFAAESQVGTDVPLLVFSDLVVVDEQLQPLASSFFSYQRLYPDRSGLRDLLFQNTVTGCSMVVNRALLVRALPIPTEAAMHDWWLALVAAAFGRVVCINRPLLKYRQHERNQVGARGWTGAYLKKRFAALLHPNSAVVLCKPFIRQAEVFFDRFGAELSPGDFDLARTVARFRHQPALARLQSAASISARKHGVLRTIALYWLLLFCNHDAE